MLLELESPRVLMRLAQIEDTSAILNYYVANQTHLEPFEPYKGLDFYTEQYWKREIHARIQAFQLGQAIKLFMFEKTDPSRIVGSINFSNIVRGAFHACTLGYSLAAHRQGQGYMTEALNIAIHYVFTEWNLHRIMAAYLPPNQRSGKLLKRLGFRVEGYAYDYLRIDGEWQDHILTSLTNPNWQPVV